MAALGAQSIASSYEQLLHVDRDGGGNSTTHVAIKDGDNGTTFGFTIATDALMMSSTNRLEFGDTGTYIHQSADGVLDLVSDTEIEINATTIDINGAVAMDGAMTGGTNITISGELDAATLDISGNADIDGTLEADAYTVDGTALDEFIADTVGAMVGSNTETGVAVTYEDGDNTLDFVLGAAQTTITSLLAADIKIGEDDETKIDFETVNEIHFYANNTEQVYVADNIFGPESDSDVDLGTTGVRWKDAFVDSITVTGEIDGASLDIEGNADINGTTNLDAVVIDGAVDMASTLQVDGAITSSSGATITTADNSDNIALVSTDADANSGPNMSFWRNSSSPADSDLLGQINWYAENDASEKTHMAQFYVSAMDVTDGTEDVRFAIQTILGGATETSRIELLPSETVINQDSKDLDFRVESDNNSEMFKVDAALNKIFINQDQDALGIDIDTESTTKAALRIIDPKTTTGNVVEINDVDALTTGNALYVASNCITTNTRNIVKIVNDNIASTGTIGLNSLNDSQGYAIKAENTNTTNSRGIHIVAGNDADDYTLLAQDRAGDENLQVFGSGAIRAKKTPAFSATPASTQTDITANNSYHTVVFGTEIFDQGANFASSVFTAPVTGRYQLNVSVEMQDVDTAATDMGLKIATSNRDYHCQLDPNFSADLTVSHWQISVLADMDASDTAQVSFAQNGGTAQANITVNSTFSGYLAC